MTERDNDRLDARQLAGLEASFHQGSADASQALARWIGKPTVVETDSIEQLPLEEATQLLGTGEDPVCFCSVEIRGLLTGAMILAFDDASGLALADLLLDQPPETAVAWELMEMSAAQETTNILCCAYLNSLSSRLRPQGVSSELLPSPPKFSRDFAESLLEFALMEQVATSDQIVVARTKFTIDDTRVNWTLLFVPDAESMARLPGLLSETDAD